MKRQTDKRATLQQSGELHSKDAASVSRRPARNRLVGIATVIAGIVATAAAATAILAYFGVVPTHSPPVRNGLPPPKGRAGFDLTNLGIARAPGGYGLKIGSAAEFKGQQSRWTGELTSTPGAIVSLLLEYRNIGTIEQHDVAMRLALNSSSIVLVHGSVQIFNNNYPKGLPAGTDALVSNGMTIGNYDPEGGAYVVADIQIGEAEEFSCGSTVVAITLYGWSVSSPPTPPAVSSLLLTVARTCT